MEMILLRHRSIARIKPQKLKKQKWSQTIEKTKIFKKKSSTEQKDEGKKSTEQLMAPIYLVYDIIFFSSLL